MAFGDALKALGDFFATQTQVEALGEARGDFRQEAGRQREQQQASLDIMRQLFGEGAATREQQFAATQFGLKGLTEAAQRQPGTGVPFQRALAGGTRQLAGQLEQFGVSPDSSVFARSTGELAGSLTASDVDRITQIQQFLAGQAPNLVPAATQFAGIAQGFGQLAGQQTGRAAGITADIGAVKGAFQSSLGERFGSAFDELSGEQEAKDKAQLASLIQMLGL